MPIEEIKVGDLVLSRHEHSPEGAVTPKKVVDVYRREARVWQVDVQGRSIRTTAEHPFYVEMKGWTAAAELRQGDRLFDPDDHFVCVDKVFDTGVVEHVYNIQVNEFHTYFVGSKEWGFSVWVHNLCAKEVLAATVGKGFLPEEGSTIARSVAQTKGDASAAITILKTKYTAAEAAAIVAQLRALNVPNRIVIVVFPELRLYGFRPG